RARRPTSENPRPPHRIGRNRGDAAAIPPGARGHRPGKGRYAGGKAPGGLPHDLPRDDRFAQRTATVSSRATAGLYGPGGVPDAGQAATDTQWQDRQARVAGARKPSPETGYDVYHT